MISGILASPGVAFAKALVLKEQHIVINQAPISSSQIDSEVARFYEARTKSAQQLEAIKEMAGKTFGEEKEAIFEGHIMLLEDEELEQVWSGKQSAQTALDSIVKRGDELLARFERANKGK